MSTALTLLLILFCKSSPATYYSGKLISAKGPGNLPKGLPCDLNLTEMAKNKATVTLSIGKPGASIFVEAFDVSAQELSPLEIKESFTLAGSKVHEDEDSKSEMPADEAPSEQSRSFKYRLAIKIEQKNLSAKYRFQKVEIKKDQPIASTSQELECELQLGVKD